MLHNEIIDKLAPLLGNQQNLAERLGVHESRLSKWKIVGIPSRHWPEFLRIAKQTATPLTLDQIEAASPRHRRRQSKTKRSEMIIELRTALAALASATAAIERALSAAELGDDR
jgi:hypothetical protein